MVHQATIIEDSLCEIESSEGPYESGFDEIKVEAFSDSVYLTQGDDIFIEMPKGRFEAVIGLNRTQAKKLRDILEDWLTNG